jgi:hypothetical protein
MQGDHLLRIDLAERGVSMKSKAFVGLLLVALLQLNILAVSAPRVTFSCQKKNTGSGLFLDIRNDGPDSLPKDTKIYYYYRTSPLADAITGHYVLNCEMRKGDVISACLTGNTETPIIECGCSLQPIRPRPPRPTTKQG